MGNKNGTTVINPLSVRCVNCGRLIQSGELCVPCLENKKMKEQIARMEIELAEARKRVTEEMILEVLRKVGKGIQYRVD